MKKLFFILAFFFTSFLFVNQTYAMTVYKSGGMAIKDDIHYDPEKDAYVVNFEGTWAVSALYIQYKDDSFSTGAEEAHKIIRAQDSGSSYFNSWVFKCNKSYDLTLYSTTESVVGEVKFTGDEIKNPSSSCSNSAEPEPEPEPEQPPSSGGGSSSSDCSGAVCECVGQLKAVNQQILGSTNSNGEKLGDVVNNTGAIKESAGKIADNTSGILEQLVTQRPTYVPGSTPVDAVSDQTDKLDKFKADEPKEAFKDDETYFKDNGDSSDEAKPLPEAPDPAECWDKTGTCKEDELKKDPSLNKEDELKKQAELNKDSFNKDDELKKDSFDKDDELSKDSFSKEDELKKDSFTKDEQMTKDSFTKSEEMQKDVPMEKDQQMQKDAAMSQDHFSQDEQMKKDSFTQSEQMTKDGQMSKDSFSQDPVKGQTEKYNQTNEYQQNNFYKQDSADYGTPKWSQ